jgi:hypothetical protein
VKAARVDVERAPRARRATAITRSPAAARRPLASVIGNRAFTVAVADGRVGPRGRVLRDPISPAAVASRPVPQKPFYRIDEATADLKRTTYALGLTPPDYRLAKSMVTNIYKSIAPWIETMTQSNRMLVVFPSTWLGVVDTCMDARNAIGEMYGKLTRAEADAPSQPQPTLLDPELARVEFARPYIEKLEGAVSYELRGAEALPDVPSKFARLTRGEMHVLAWLEQHRSEITAAAAKFNVDRRAVAGAVAWEAITQVKTGSLRAVGPGKVHKWEFSGSSAAEEVEQRGYVPTPQDAEERERRLANPPTAFEYIAAIMAACADISARHGQHFRNDPGVLTTIYQGWSPSKWEAHMAEKAKTHAAGAPWDRPSVENPMGIWVDQHIPYLEEAVGFTAAEERAAAEAPHTATPEGTIQRQTAPPAEDPAVTEAKALLAETPKTTPEHAAWLLKAGDLGFATFNPKYKPDDDLRSLKDGKKVKGIDPAGDVDAVLTMHDLVKGVVTRWLADPKAAKAPVTLGSFLRTGKDPHAGHAIDVNDLGFTTSVEGVIRVLGDLSPGTYGIGLPFQGDFFPPASELGAKKAAAEKAATEKKVDPAAVSNALVLWAAPTYKASWDATAKAWAKEEVDAYGAAFTLLKSKQLRDTFAEMRKNGFSFVIFPDNPEHIHIDRR